MHLQNSKEENPLSKYPFPKANMFDFPKGCNCNNDFDDEEL